MSEILELMVEEPQSLADDTLSMPPNHSPLFLFFVFFLIISWMFCFSGKKEEVWVIDDLIIEGSSLHNLPVIVDSFDEGPNESNWLFFPGGNPGLYCPYQKTGL